MAGTSTFRWCSASTVIRLSSSSTNLQVLRQANSDVLYVNRFLTFGNEHGISSDVNGYEWISGDIEKLKN
jgi:hypothetical protein